MAPQSIGSTDLQESHPAPSPGNRIRTCVSWGPSPHSHSAKAARRLVRPRASHSGSKDRFGRARRRPFIGPVANSGAGRRMGRGGSSFTLCSRREVRSRARAVGSARTRSKPPQGSRIKPVYP